MQPEFVYSMASASDLEDVSALLVANDLPHTDVHRHIDNFVIVRSADKLIAVAGVELHGRHALLRSVCVDAGHRGEGLAGRLCESIDAYVRTVGAEELWLLTTTAQSFFAHLRFAVRARDEAPIAISQTEEFRSLCPASAVCMSRRVEARAPGQ